MSRGELETEVVPNQHILHTQWKEKYITPSPGNSTKAAKGSESEGSRTGRDL